MRSKLDTVQPAIHAAVLQLDADLSLGALARVAGVSPFQFHRTFSAVVGETPKRFAARLRVERAACALVTASDPLIEIALNCGFKNPETFSRAFRRAYGMSPREYRARAFPGLSTDAIAKHSAFIRDAGPCIGLYHYLHGDAMDLTIELRDLPAQPALFVKRRIRRADIANTIGAALPLVFKHSQRVGGAMASAPMARYSEMGPGMLTIETGFIVATPVAGDGEVEAVTLPAGQAACATHVGPYDTLQQTHSAMEVWIEEHGLKAAAMSWEIYVTDPGQVPDPKDWKTEVYWPVSSG
jgi:AraC family transcriptional regulator